MIVSSSAGKEFNPITFNITVESIEELAILAASFNHSFNSLLENAPSWANFVMCNIHNNKIDEIQMKLYNLVEKYSKRF
ncbi:MAG: hypothetical protein RBR68_15220 [Tenuifilaceae bacterium]|nr:hypothetical protein [Tenuifilaceae bacterium]